MPCDSEDRKAGRGRTGLLPSGHQDWAAGGGGWAKWGESEILPYPVAAIGGPIDISQICVVRTP